MELRLVHEYTKRISLTAGWTVTPTLSLPLQTIKDLIISAGKQKKTDCSSVIIKTLPVV